MSHKHSTAALRQNHEIIWERKILQTFFIDFPSSCLFLRMSVQNANVPFLVL